jgi:radical SAM protein with 4Fe4S-binding SPASM domain
MSRDPATDAVEWAKAFRLRTAVERVPVSGTLELTSRCNLRCVHCYLGDQTEQHSKREAEMSTEKVLRIIDQIHDAGCLYLLITGGDPMMRRDFAEIYRYARCKGMLITVFCDGILVNDTIIELFKEYPPFKVDISIYGSTAETYEKITRVKGSHAKMLRGLDRLRDAGIPYSLKTVLMTVNRHELDAMRAMAEDRGVSFRVDTAIFPCLSGSGKDPIDLRVEPEQAVQLEMSSPKQVSQWMEYSDAHQGSPATNRLYECGAGQTSFFIDPFGDASPCLMTTNYRYSLKNEDFATVWSRDLVQIRNRIASTDSSCSTCDMKAACTACPAFHFQETGHEEEISEYVCETTRYRWRAIQEAKKVRASSGASTMPRQEAAVDRGRDDDGS